MRECSGGPAVETSAVAATAVQQRLQALLVSPSAGVDHIAYATRCSRKTIELLVRLGFEVVIEMKRVERFNTFASKLRNQKGDVIEVLEPIDPSRRSPVDSALINFECAVCHVCYKVDDFDKAFEEFVGLDCVVLTQPFESYIFDGYMVSHLYHPHLGVFEIFGEKK